MIRRTGFQPVCMWMGIQNRQAGSLSYVNRQAGSLSYVNRQAGSLSYLLIRGSRFCFPVEVNSVVSSVG